MFLENDTKEVEKIISHDSMKTHFGRNLIVFFAIFLTTVMLIGVMVVGFSLYHAEEKYSDLSAGPGADGFAIMGGQEQEQEIKQYPDVEWAALVQNASYKRIQNPMTIGCDVELLVTNSVYFDNNYISLKTGKFPEKEKEILISDTLAKSLKLKEPVGQDVMFTITVRENGKEVKKDMDLSICGVYQNPLSSLSAEYEEIYTSQEFIRKFNPDIMEKPGSIYVKLEDTLDKTEIYQRLQQINGEVGGFGVVAKLKESDNQSTIIMVILAALIIMLAAYFIIFNVFSISLTNDIRFFGMMKTIGASTKQIRAILNRQVYSILPVALILGILVGYICSRGIAPHVVGLMEGLKNFYEPISILFPALFTVLFVFITVKLSCLQSFRKVSKISPMEAVRYIAPRRMNMLFASISLILCCIIFSSVLNFFFGYQVSEQVKERNIYDFKLMNHLYLLGNGSESFESIPKELCEELRNLPFVKDMEVVYAAHSQPDYYEDVMGESYYLRAKVKNKGLLAKDFKRAETENLTYSFDRTGEDLRVPICGVSAETVQKTVENGNFKIVDGAIEPEKFASGNYIIYQPFGWSANPLIVHAGDDMEIEVFDDNTGEYHTKILKVMAVVINDDPYGRTQFSEMGLCLSDKTFCELYTDHDEMIASVGLNSIDSSEYKEQQNKIDRLIKKYSGYQITFSSKYNSTLHFEKERNTSFLIGIFFAIFFSVIGITNTVNSIANMILSNRIVYARMQAIGMTQLQLMKELIWNNLKTYGVATLGFIPLEYLLLKVLYPQFNIKVFGISVILVFLAVVVILVVTSIILTRYLNKDSIVQRLRGIE